MKSFSAKSKRKKKEVISFHIERAVFRPLARNDLSFRETVVGFIAGLNFLWQGQRSDGRVNEQSRSETVQEIESGRKSEAERRRQSDIRDGTQTLVYPLTHSLPFYTTYPTPATCIHTLRHTFTREYRLQSQTMPFLCAVTELILSSYPWGLLAKQTYKLRSDSVVFEPPLPGPSLHCPIYPAPLYEPSFFPVFIVCTTKLYTR